jgi:hypothetical protein
MSKVNDCFRRSASIFGEVCDVLRDFETALRKLEDAPLVTQTFNCHRDEDHAALHWSVEASKPTGWIAWSIDVAFGDGWVIQSGVDRDDGGGSESVLDLGDVRGGTDDEFAVELVRIARRLVRTRVPGLEMES